MPSNLAPVLLFVGALLSACSLVVDGRLDGKEAASDCAGADDGTSCELEAMSRTGVCQRQACTSSTCGDGLTDPVNGEECDDGNEVSGDGCEPGTCELTCASDDDCDDAVVCNGSETCDSTSATCTAGTDAPDETSCSLDGGSDGECRLGTCRVIGCGNDLPDAGEECDDGNDVSNDGCEPDCTITCMTDEDCAEFDTSICDGTDTCDLATNSCVGGEFMVCNDDDPCTEDSCDPVEGCVFDPLPFDMDEDGHPVMTGECAGDDCDDADPEVYGGAAELCDGKDNDCNGSTDEVAPVWFTDCDGDGFSQTLTGQVQACDEPSPQTGCSGGWTTTRPSGPSTTDCIDDNALVFPGQNAWITTSITGAPTATDYDYDCDGVEEKQYSALPSGVIPIACRVFSGGCFGTSYMTSNVSCGGTGTLSYCRQNRTICERASRTQTVGCH